jgi:formamidopyrimidine-DNA glycosylase
MPELPEVETTRLGLLPRIKGKQIAQVIVRDRRLRWPIPRAFAQVLTGRTVTDVGRRGKYLLWACRLNDDYGYVLSHLGMSGSLRILQQAEAPGKHDHVDFVFSDGLVVRYTDPRRFGALLWLPGREPSHPLIDSLGPEPLSNEFDGDHLHAASRGRTVSVKEFLMNGHIVVGVGNIYASESLFRAGINPRLAAGRVSRDRYRALAEAVRDTLAKAIRAGGSSLRDYVQADGELGYFQVNAMVYDREGLPCRVCKTPVRAVRQGQRSTFYCPRCQR